VWFPLLCVSFSGQCLVAQTNAVQFSVVASPSSLQINQSEGLLITLTNATVSRSTLVRNGDVLELYFSLADGEITDIDGEVILTSKVFRDVDWIIDKSRALNPIRLVYKGVDQLWPALDSVSVRLRIRPPTYGALGLVALRAPADRHLGEREWQVTPINIVNTAFPMGPDVGTTQSTSPRTNRALTALQESDIIGLVQDLTARAVKGPGFIQSRAAVINDTGGLEGAVGSASDCVHVDGTSGPCGGAANSFADKEVPSGVLDGVNLTFTVLIAPAPASSLHLFRNGVLQKEGFDYSLSGARIIFFSVSTPLPGDTILASYRH
jgi:hypothetical protein